MFQGFGFTLKGNSDFALTKFVAGHPETFDPHYGVKDIQGDGDIFKSENIDAFQNYVYKCTMHNGVHIMMADGVRFSRRDSTDELAIFSGIFGRRTRKYPRNTQ